MTNRRTFLLGVAGVLTLGATAKAARPAQGMVVHPQPIPVPALDIRDGDGAARGLDQLRGQPVLLNLWASWCLPCITELPALDRLAASGFGGIAVIALSLDRGGAAAVMGTYRRLDIHTLPVRVDAERRAGEILSASMLPTTLLIAKDGKEVARFVGAADWNGPQAREVLRRVLTGDTLVPDMAPSVLKAGNTEL
jgi:thiol-disulfide isomerase/thioredoxin